MCVYTHTVQEKDYIYTLILRGISDGREPIFLSRSLDSRDAVSTERFRFVVQLNQTDYVDYVQEIKRSDVWEMSCGRCWPKQEKNEKTEGLSCAGAGHLEPGTCGGLL